MQQDNKLKIFVSAFACDPTLGSESGVGWNWVLEMSKYFDIWVLTSGFHRHAIESWLSDHPEFSHIRFIFYDWPKWALWWKKGLTGMRIYYNIWELFVNRIVRKTMMENDIHVFHHLTYGNAIWPVCSYGQKQFFIWGPFGGLESVPDEFSRHYELKDRFVEWIRRRLVGISRMNIGFRSRCRHANLILCKTEYTLQCIPNIYRYKAVLFTDVATVVRGVDDFKLGVESHIRTEFLSVARLDAWRGFDLAIEAIALAVKTNPNIHLSIMGDGSDRIRLENLAQNLGVEEYVSFLGSLSAEEYLQRMQETDVVVNTALKEGAVTVSFDAMALGKPLLCIDTTGYTRYFKEDFSIVIPRASRDEVIKGLSDGMIRMTDSDERLNMGKRAREVSKLISWEHHGEEIKSVILKAYSDNSYCN
jgi:glycosyltransferase involved in cell wall biosynthesis